MIAATARAFVAVLGLEDAVAKAVSDAPDLSDEQRVALRGILLAPDMTEAPLTDGAPVLADAHQVQADERTAPT